MFKKVLLSVGGVQKKIIKLGIKHTEQGGKKKI